MNTTSNPVASTQNNHHKQPRNRAANRNRRNPAPAEVERPRLLFFYAPASGASRRAEGFLAQVLQRRHNHDTFRIARIDADQRPDLARRLKITDLPTILVVAEGRIHARLAKPKGAAQLTQLLSPWLK